MPLGVEFYLDMDDRRVLETIILPYFAGRPEFGRVLFIGCDWYTRGYRKFFPNPGYWTLDFAPSQKRYGSRRHIVDGAENVAHHFKAESLDLIICNGVYGFGLDDPRNFDAAVDGCHNALRPGGVFLLGWDDNPRRTPFPLDHSEALKKFRRFLMPPLATEHYLTANTGRHTFDFFTK
jgi:SAM-dependent methyltransferase